MPSQEQIDSEATQSDLAGRVAELEAWKDLMIRNILGPAQFRPGLLRFGGNLMQLDNTGVLGVATDSGDSFGSVPTGIRMAWVKDSIDGTVLAEIGGGYSTPGALTLANVVMRARQQSDAGSTAKVGIWDGTNLRWETVLSTQDSVSKLVLGVNNAGTLDSVFVINRTDADNYVAQIRQGGTLVSLGGGSSMPMPPLVGTDSWHCLGTQLAANASTAAVSTAWQSANRAIYIPLLVTEDITVVKLWCYNGATASGNVNMCLYDSAWAQVANTEIGSTAQSGTSVIQEFNITDTAITAGQYYIAIALDNTTGTIFRFGPAAALLQGWGVAQEESAFNLPATATPVDVTGAYLPICGIATRTQVA